MKGAFKAFGAEVCHSESKLPSRGEKDTRKVSGEPWLELWVGNRRKDVGQVGLSTCRARTARRTPGPVRWAQEPPPALTCSRDKHSTCSCFAAVKVRQGVWGPFMRLVPHIHHHCSLVPPLLSRTLAGKAVPLGSSALPTVKRWASKKGGRRQEMGRAGSEHPAT